jgi:alpha-L-fucosidase
MSARDFRFAAAAGVLSIVTLGAASAPAAAEENSQRDDPLAWWRAARFGLFIHWGPVSLKGTEIGWSRGQDVPTEEYDSLYRQFNPTEFDADEWVRIAKGAGMKYVVITSKHHDGFCLWDSAYTDYDIMSTPFHRDVLAELSAACRRHGLKFCTYYSICDWHHPDYPTDSPGGKGEKPNPNMPRYVEYLKNQLIELIDKYGPLGVLWFDGQWEPPWTAEYGDDLYRYLKDIQPDLIINNRVSKGRHRSAGTSTQNADNPGDYDTPEQRIGAFNRDRPWETCMTICHQWAWKPNDPMKSLKECIHALVRTAGGDGNFLFNVGPMPDGRIEPRQADRLREMGEWLDKYGESIYGTRGGPLKPSSAGVSTCRGNKVYAHILKWPDAAVLLPPMPWQITRHSVLTGGQATLDQTREGTRVWVRPEDRDELDTIVVLELDQSAEALPPIDWRIPTGSIACGKAVTASNTFRNMPEYAPEKAVDDDDQTRWATNAGTRQAWLEVDLGAPQSFSHVRIREAVEYGERIQRFQLEYKAGDEWKVALRGTSVGQDYARDFPPVTAQHVRLRILEATEGPTIWEFQLFDGED